MHTCQGRNLLGVRHGSGIAIGVRSELLRVRHVVVTS